MADIKICDICGKKIPTFEGKENYHIRIDALDDDMQYIRDTKEIDLCEEHFVKMCSIFNTAKAASTRWQ